MKIHLQPAIRTAHGRDDAIVGYTARKRHTAFDVACPLCEARPGGACKRGDGHMSLLTVHVERAEASL